MSGSSSGPSTPAEKTAALLSALWQRNLPRLRDRLALLDRAALAAKEDLLTGPLRTEAAAAAHNLAGSLGMFGYGEGTQLARKLEAALLEPETPPEKLITLTQQLRSALGLEA